MNALDLDAIERSVRDAVADCPRLGIDPDNLMLGGLMTYPQALALIAEVRLNRACDWPDLESRAERALAHLRAIDQFRGDGLDVAHLRSAIDALSADSLDDAGVSR